jgi:shikimate dehydrogenase
MAVFQAADSFELFTGVQPDRERMLRHFSELVGQAVSAG